MTDVFSLEQRSAVMRAVKGQNTGPERAVRKLLTGLGLRYRLHRADLPGAPDIVLPGCKTVVFVHGCFWHGHDCSRGARSPKTRAEYWQEKISRNRARDLENHGRLSALGWWVVTVWECELRSPRSLQARLADLFRGPQSPA